MPVYRLFQSSQAKAVKELSCIKVIWNGIDSNKAPNLSTYIINKRKMPKQISRRIIMYIILYISFICKLVIPALPVLLSLCACVIIQKVIRYFCNCSLARRVVLCWWFGCLLSMIGCDSEQHQFTEKYNQRSGLKVESSSEQVELNV